ncbi:hypothetical protein BKA62DRAFT_485778 [Auriculariales sp. MPI-PUGE-AT-0066]|nr:hypothetical protein BKA62DRAFT_485778 [Auriculariales sp. MPI-PUGE-AT-0066]
MVKRAATPPPSKDEPKFLTIIHPYPPHANLELKEDQVEMSRWLACIIQDPSKLHSLYYKPSGHNHVVIEISRDMPHFDQLLGCHRWENFLQSPTDEQRQKESKVYWCSHNSTRAMEKLGWKRVDIDDEWFKGFTLQNKKIVSPYPRSAWCDIPVEDVTILHICRPIPKRAFGEIDGTAPEITHVKPAKNKLAPIPRVVPGAASWVAAKSSGTTPTPQVPKKNTTPTMGAWSKPINVSSAAKPKAQTTSPWVSSEPNVNGMWASVTAGKSTTIILPPLAPRAPSPKVEDLTKEQLDEKMKTTSFDWSVDAEEEERQREQVPLSTGTLDISMFSPAGAADDNTVISFNPLGDDDEDDYGYSIQPSWGLPMLSQEDAKRTELTKAGPKKQTHMPPAEDNGGYSGGLGKSLFVGWTCPDHGVTCKPGICPTAADYKRQKERERKRKGREGGMSAFTHPAHGRADIQEINRGNGRSEGGGWRRGGGGRY